MPKIHALLTFGAESDPAPSPPVASASSRPTAGPGPASAAEPPGRYTLRPLVEIQEFVTKGITSQLRYGVTPRFVDQRGQLIEALLDRHGLTEWGYGEDVVDVYKKDQSVFLRVGSREVLAMFENVASIDEVRQTTAAFLEWALEMLGVERIRTVGVRSYWLAAADSFAELNEHLLERFAGTMGRILEPFGTKPSDSGWTFDFHDQDPKHNLRLGPMTAEQAMGLFRDQEKENYPPQALYLDVDRLYTEDPMEREQALRRWGSAFERNIEISQAICRELTRPS